MGVKFAILLTSKPLCVNVCVCVEMWWVCYPGSQDAEGKLYDVLLYEGGSWMMDLPGASEIHTLSVVLQWNL